MADIDQIVSAHILCKGMASLQCEYGCESAKNYCDWNSKDNVGTVCFGEARDEQFLHQLRNVFSAYDF